jgi:CHAT domain-containing protein
LLLKPLQSELASARDLVIVPDAAFLRVPFAALPFDTSGRYLVEHASITIAPSAATALDRRRAKPVRGDSVVAVGNPDFDRQRFPQLSPLLGAEREAMAIGKMYPLATVLLGSQATRVKVLAAMKNTALLHLGTHAIATSDPHRSHIVLAPEEGDAGILFLSDIEQSSIAPRLVVLAGCRTASTEGDQSTVGTLALAFIAAGAANALGSLENLDDDRATLFLGQFHRQLRAGAAPADALRTVQIEMLRSPDRQLSETRLWSSLQLYGIVKNVDGE